MTHCPHCGCTLMIGKGEFETCAKCHRFTDAAIDVSLVRTLDAIDAAFNRQRAQLTPEQRAIERTIRQSCFPHPRLLDTED